jgi:TraM recognition site of TraD and TraG
VTPTALQHAPYYAAMAAIAAAAGVLLAWWLRRHTTVSIRNVYVAAAIALAVDAAALYARAAIVLPAMVPVTSCAIAAAAVGRRWRLSDLGAGEELRTHERARRWLWQPPPTRAAGERVYLTTQGQLVRERQWPAAETSVPLTTDDAGPRLPRRSGRHIFVVGATGSGKTTTALRSAAGRTVKDNAALFFVDQKGDPDAERFLRRLAAATGRPFILVDPRAADTDHWQPLWGERPAEVVARVLAGIETSEPYYADTLRQHVGIVASVLHAAGYWPPSFPLLIEASQLGQFDRVVALAREHQQTHPHLWRRVGHQAKFVASPEGEKALGGGLVRLDLVMGEAWRSVLNPRTDAAGDQVGVNLARAIRERAIVLWRTHVDQMPDEAQTITAVVLNDVQACAVEAQRDGPAPWTCVLDEFGAVIATAAGQALALLQRARTHEGQITVITQSLADIEALTGQVGLLASMADNFAAFVVHRQTSPESRDWAAKLMGTNALWQSTDQTSAYAATGAGSRRRVREFRVSSDAFAELAVGQAFVHTTLGPPPALCQVTPVALSAATALVRLGDARGRCEMAVHPATQLPPAAKKARTKTAAARTADATTSAPRPRRARATRLTPPPAEPEPELERASVPSAPSEREDRADDV